MPDDFFKELPGLSKAQEDELIDFMNEKLDQALEFANGDADALGLDFVTETKGVKVHQKDTPGSDIRLVRAKTSIAIASDLFTYACLSPENEDFRRIFHMLGKLVTCSCCVYLYAFLKTFAYIYVHVHN